MCIASTIIMKGLTTSRASFFEALHNFYLASVCEFRSMILHMILTRRDPIFEGTNTNDTKGDRRSARLKKGFFDVHRVYHNYEGPND
jgi:hypothetical protein